MKKLAQHLLRVPRRRPTIEKPPHPASVYTPLDSWARDQQQNVPRRERRRAARERKEAELKAQVPEISTGKRKRKDLKKVRNRRLTFAVSKEEEHMIRLYTLHRSLKISTWIRELVFDEMDMDMPARD